MAPTASFSIRDIAQKIQLPNEELTVATSRALNWAKEGLIRASGDRHPGIGRKRLFSKSAMWDAMLIQALVNSGLTAVAASSILKDTNVKSKVALAAQPAEQPFLVIGRGFKGNVRNVRMASLDELMTVIKRCLFDDVHYIDIAKLHTLLETEPVFNVVHIKTK